MDKLTVILQSRIKRLEAENFYLKKLLEKWVKFFSTNCTCREKIDDND